MVANKSIEAKEDLGKVSVQVPDYEVMKELLGDHHVGKKLSSPKQQKLLKPLMLMLPNELRRIVSSRLLTMPSCSVRKPDIIQWTTAQVLGKHTQGMMTTIHQTVPYRSYSL